MFIVDDNNLFIEALTKTLSILYIKDPANMVHVEYTPLHVEKTVVPHDRAISYL